MFKMAAADSIDILYLLLGIQKKKKKIQPY